MATQTLETRSDEVLISDVTGTRTVIVKLAEGRSASDLIDEAVSRLGIPRHDPDGGELAFSIRNDATSELMFPTEVVEEAGDFTLEPTISAGA